jgi:hypothetical protein
MENFWGRMRAKRSFQIHQSEKVVTSQLINPGGMSERKKRSKPANEGVNEPNVDYLSSGSGKNTRNTIVISSFEEQEESMRRYWASITPLQRLRDLNILVKVAFGLTPEKLEHPGLRNKINIIPYGEYFS